MKRYGDLYDKIISIDNLRLADKKARKGKKKSYGVVIHDRNSNSNIIKLHEDLKNKTYKTSKYNIFTIFTTKERTIYQLPYYPDRIVHHAVMNIMEPIWVSMFTKDTFSCIKKRGIHGCLKQVKLGLMDVENTTYCLKLDIRKYYPSIDHTILKEIIRKKIKCEDTLDMLDEVIDSAEGIPIGNYLSQFFANLYLTYFDHWIKENKRVTYYYRYADDMVILHSEKDYLWRIFYDIRDYLNSKLNLEIKANYQVFPVEARGIDFVGYVLRHNYVLIRKTIKSNFCQKVAKLRKIKISEKEFKMQTSAWTGLCKFADCNNLTNKMKYESNVHKQTRCI